MQSRTGSQDFISPGYYFRSLDHLSQFDCRLVLVTVIIFNYVTPLSTQLWQSPTSKYIVQEEREVYN